MTIRNETILANFSGLGVGCGHCDEAAEDAIPFWGPYMNATPEQAYHVAKRHDELFDLKHDVIIFKFVDETCLKDVPSADFGNKH